jgi:cytochrome c556
MNQLSIDFARAAGESAANACTSKAHRSDPEFTAKAKVAILAHLRAVGRASGEELVNVAIAHGARPHDARAFGSVFQSLSRDGSIRTVGFCLREKGHGTAGGRIWSIT